MSEIYYHYTPDDNPDNERIEWRLEGSRWVPVITAYDHTEIHVPDDDPDDEPTLSLEEEIALLKAQVAELEYQLSRSFLLID